MLAQALLPYALGRAVDDGLAAGDNGALLEWAARAARAGDGPGVRRRARGTGPRSATGSRPSFRMVQVVSHHAARSGPGGAGEPDDGRGRRHRLERRHARRRRLRHHGAPRRGGRLVLRRRGILLSTSFVLGLVVLLGVPVLVHEPLVRDPAAAGAAARAARGGRPADRPRRRHGLGAARPARDRRRAGLPRPLPEPLRAGAPRGRSRRAAAVHARLGAGPAARDLRRHRHLARRAARRRGPHPPRRARRLLRLRGLPRHPAPHRGRGRRQGHARVRRRAAGCWRS